MKKNNLLKILLLLVILFNVTGCLKRDELENISIMTTSYPLEYILRRLYGEHSVVNSIYPDDTNTYIYELSPKQISDFSKKELFVYNGLFEKDRAITVNFLEKNKKILIIDSASGIDSSYSVEESWLNPSNLLMMAQNIRDGLEKYISNSYLIKDINANYEELKVDLSELDADLKLAATNAIHNTIVVTNDSLMYLEKYGLNVISLDDTTNSVSEKDLALVQELINSNKINYIFSLQFDNENKYVPSLIQNTAVEVVTFRRLDTITDSNRNINEDYISLMSKNIELLKEELFK